MATLEWRKSSHSSNGDACVEVAWRKSSYSSNGGDCVEVGWRKSSRSNGGDACVEVAPRDQGVAVRDSKSPTGPTLAIPTPGWRTFVRALN